MKNLKTVLAWLEKAFQPITMFGLGTGTGMMFTIALIKDRTLIKFLYEWQSLIGTIIGTAGAVALFLWQRNIDRREQTRYRLFTLQHTLNQIRNHPDNTKVTLGESEIRRYANFIPRAPGDFTNRNPVDTTIAGLQKIEGYCRNCLQLLRSIPRDLYMPAEYTAQIDELERGMITYIERYNTLNQRAGSDDWSEQRMNGVFSICHEAAGISDGLRIWQTSTSDAIDTLAKDTRLK